MAEGENWYEEIDNVSDKEVEPPIYANVDTTRTNKKPPSPSRSRSGSRSTTPEIPPKRLSSSPSSRSPSPDDRPTPKPRSEDGSASAIYENEEPRPLEDAPESRSNSYENIWRRSRSVSPAEARTRSRSPSPVGVVARSRSPSPVGVVTRSRSPSPVGVVTRSRSPSPVGVVTRSRSASPAEVGTRPRSRSISPVANSRSRSTSPVVTGSRSPVVVESGSEQRKEPTVGSGISPATNQQHDIKKNFKSTKQEGSVIHSAFKGAGQKPGIEIWRLENSEPVLQQAKNHGKFYSGDCYIVLNTKENAGVQKFVYNLHYWLGSECDQENSVAARTMELDDNVLSGGAVQYREVQGHETSMFLSYFKDNIRYLISDSDIKKANKKRLFQVKGKKNIRIAQVPCMCGSLNQGDTFVLEDGKHIYVWIGPGSTRKEKLAGLAYARLLRNEEHKNKAHIHVVQDWKDNIEFYKALGSRDKAIKAADEHDDEDIIRRLDQQTLLFKFDAEGMFEIHTRPLVQDLLERHCIFILDSGPTGIYVWTGSKCPPELKHKVWTLVQNFLDTRGYPYYLPVVKLCEGRETEFFKRYFNSWHEPANKKQPSGNRKNMRDWMPDDGSGKVKVYRVERDNLVRVSSRAHGVFFMTESYVIRYRLTTDESLHIIYIWQGNMSTMEEKEASIKHAMAMDQKYGGSAIQVRVAINKEPKHFVKIFNGRVTYLMNGHISGFISLNDYEGYDPKLTYMFQVRGTPEVATATQVTARAASLNSNDVFIISTAKKHYIWTGKHASENETAAAMNILNEISPNKSHPNMVDEGYESGIFWGALDGEEPHVTEPRTKNKHVYIPPRLLHCILISGMYTVEELVDFSQDDLVEDDVMLLDTYDEIFMWIGRKASEIQTQRVYRTAYTYLRVDPGNRSQDDMTVVVVKQGYEPPPFTECFPSWDPERWHKIMKFKKLIQAVREENEKIDLQDENDNQIVSFYKYEELKRKVPPEGIDVSRKELYLSPEDFEAVFHMDKTTFNNLPEWKRISLKKQHSLF